MSTMLTEAERTVERTFESTIESLREEMGKIEYNVVTGYTLADAIREGSSVSKQAYGTFGNDSAMCALSAAACAANARFANK